LISVTMSSDISFGCCVLGYRIRRAPKNSKNRKTDLKLINWGTA